MGAPWRKPLGFQGNPASGQVDPWKGAGSSRPPCFTPASSALLRLARSSLCSLQPVVVALQSPSGLPISQSVIILVIMVLFRHAILGVVAASSTLAHSGHPVDETQKPMVLGDKCHHPAYKSHILSQSPLVIYLTDFLTAEERAHLVDIT